jgi:5-methylcytosine-specific restriction endonuclease McrA
LSKVFVLDTSKRPLDPVHPAWARKLLSSGQAAVWRRYPFTIILKKEINQGGVHPLRLKLDPGSKVTGIAVVNDASGEVVFAAELEHRGQAIKAALDNRRAVRRNRRQRKTQYRKPRFESRRRSKGWLAPSLMSRISNIETWARRIIRSCPIAALSQELVKFDMQAMDNPEIEGMQYQQGTLAGYEVREYLLLKWGHRCAYCLAQDVPLQVEHIVSRAHGGSNRVSNLCLACEACNSKKGTQDIRTFLQQEPELLARILAQAKASLKDAAAVNATRWALYERLKALGLPIECGSGGLTKYNRVTRGLEKAHWLDAACVGTSTQETLLTKHVSPLHIKAVGTGCRQMCRMDHYGFPRTGPKQAKRIKGFQTGDLVRAVVPTGKNAGTYMGRVAVRSTGSFNITTSQKTVQGISHRFCTVIHRCDGYRYTHERRAVLPPAS